MSTLRNISQQELVERLKQYFDIRELVDETVFNTYGERAWRFFDYRLLVNLLWIRECIGSSITVNNWYWGGRFSQRGLRTNISPIVAKKTRLYLTAHLRGGAIDFDVEGMTSIEVRAWLVARSEEIPFPIRLERKLRGKQINWVHMDTDFESHNPRVYEFDI